MPVDRFFIDAPLNENSEVILKGEELHHLLVIRAKLSEHFELVNGKNLLAFCRLIALDKFSATFFIDKIERIAPFSPKIVLCQALPRLNRLDTILEKCTELNVSEILLFAGEKSEKTALNEHQIERAKKIILSAVKQCGRLDLPTLCLMPPLLLWTEKEIQYPAYFGDLSPDAPLFSKVFQKKEALSFFIGPESGFSDKEEAHLRELKVQGVKLTSTILRTDTAPIVAAALISHLSLS